MITTRLGTDTFEVQCYETDECFAKKANNGQIVCSILRSTYPNSKCPFRKTAEEYKAIAKKDCVY